MQENKKPTITEEELARAFTGEAPEPEKAEKHGKKRLSEKAMAIMLIAGFVGIIGGVTMLLIGLLNPAESSAKIEFPKIPSKDAKEVEYSALTGEELAEGATKNAPVYCVQTPNGTDGARPQVGLNTAGVVFEAIAEAGITRFAAIYQNPSSAIIGPIRSLRIYYLEWDTPFDCTIVHAGGSGDALAAVSYGGYKDLTEDYSYMYRGSSGPRRWNNLFTTSNKLKEFSTNRAYETSDVKGFTRMTPEESAKSRVDSSVKEKLNITKAAKENTSESTPTVGAIGLKFGSIPTYNVNYTYDGTTNTYLRSFGTGEAHQVYSCPSEDLGERDPEGACNLVQMAPSVVVAMVVSERRAADNYHEDIDAIGSGNAFVFQNGTVIQGTWQKPTKEDQIKFLDGEGNEIKLAPGQTIVSAVPSYGSVDF